MALVKYNPYKPSVFNSFIDRFFNDDFPVATNKSFSPSVDISESEAQFDIEFHIPGVKKEEINIDINEDRLTVSGERKFENETKEKNFTRLESSYGKFSRTFYLPENVSQDKIDAKYADGVLRLIVPKTEPKDNRRTIAVK